MEQWLSMSVTYSAKRSTAKYCQYHNSTDKVMFPMSHDRSCVYFLESTQTEIGWLVGWCDLPMKLAWELIIRLLLWTQNQLLHVISNNASVLEILTCLTNLYWIWSVYLGLPPNLCRVRHEYCIRENRWKLEK